jgi:sugar O-acyltransferase (sialic acid O-acetyltransferase NeuD family)
MFIGMGYTGANRIRRDKYLAAKQKGYRFANLIHPTACVASNAVLGENCLIMEQVLLQPYTVLGDNVFLWSGAAVLHHTVVEDHCFLGGRCVIAGCSRLGQGSFVGTGAVVRDCIDIPPGSIVGAGAVVLRSPDGAMVHRARYAESIEFKDWAGSL